MGSGCLASSLIRVEQDRLEPTCSHMFHMDHALSLFFKKVFWEEATRNKHLKQSFQIVCRLSLCMSFTNF